MCGAQTRSDVVVLGVNAHCPASHTVSAVHTRSLCVVFAVLSSRWNHSRFNAQVRGLDLRDLASEQFDAFGRLVDKSFQVPREMQDMAT